MGKYKPSVPKGKEIPRIRHPATGEEMIWAFGKYRTGSDLGDIVLANLLIELETAPDNKDFNGKFTIGEMRQGLGIKRRRVETTDDPAYQRWLLKEKMMKKAKIKKRRRTVNT